MNSTNTAHITGTLAAKSALALSAETLYQMDIESNQFHQQFEQTFFEEEFDPRWSQALQEDLGQLGSQRSDIDCRQQQCKLEYAIMPHNQIADFTLQIEQRLQSLGLQRTLVQQPNELNRNRHIVFLTKVE